MMTLKNVPSVPIGSSSRRAPKIVSEGHNNGNRRRRRCISAAYRDTGFRKRGMSILQAPPRATSKGGNGEWWPESPRWRAGRPPAGRVTYYFQQLWHACMSALRDHRGVPETPSGALNEHKTKTAADYKRRSARPRWSWATYVELVHSLCSFSASRRGLRAPECTHACMPESE